MRLRHSTGRRFVNKPDANTFMMIEVWDVSFWKYIFILAKKKPNLLDVFVEI